MSASPELAERTALRLDRIEFGQRAPRTSRSVHTVAAYLVTK